MKKTKLFICLMLSVLCVVTCGCSGGDDYYPYNGSGIPGGGGGSTTSLNGATWRYDQGTRLSALIEFSAQRFTVAVTEYGNNTNSYQTAGSYSYDGNTLEFTYDETTYKLWCSVKGNGNTLAGTKWMSEVTTKYGEVITGYLNLFADGSIYMENFLFFIIKGGKTSKEYNDVFYTYDGNTIEFTDTDQYGKASLQCGRILYEMSKAKSNY